MHVLPPSTIIAYSVFSNIVKRIYSVFRTLFFFLFRTKVATFCLITSPITAFLADPVISCLTENLISLDEVAA